MEKPDIDKCTDKQYSKWYWSAFNDICQKCKNSCKQSHVVKVICKNYIGKD